MLKVLTLQLLPFGACNFTKSGQCRTFGCRGHFISIALLKWVTLTRLAIWAQGWVSRVQAMS